MKESGVIDKTALVYGQMNEPPGARMRVGLTGLTMAEYFRDVGGQDVYAFGASHHRLSEYGFFSITAPPCRLYVHQLW